MVPTKEMKQVRSQRNRIEVCAYSGEVNLESMWPKKCHKDKEQNDQDKSNDEDYCNELKKKSHK